MSRISKSLIAGFHRDHENDFRGLAALGRHNTQQLGEQRQALHWPAVGSMGNGQNLGVSILVLTE
jgi:hypothetical protein